jgi:hypothetical protein
VLATINAIPTQEEDNDDAKSFNQALNAERPASALDTSTETQNKVRNLKIYEDY